MTCIAARILGAAAQVLRRSGSTYALCAGSALAAMGCALIDPLDALPSNQGVPGSAVGGTSSATNSAGAGSDALGGFSGNSGGAQPEGECKTNADCEANSRCVPTRPTHVCVPLTTLSFTGTAGGPCPVVLNGEQASDPNAIFIGAFAPLDQTSIEAQTISAIYQMATQEFKHSGGLKGVFGGPPSPLVVIVCNNSEASTPFALQHLIESVQVPAVLTAIEPGQLLEGFNTYRDTFFISAYSSSEELANVSEGRVWTMVGQPADYAEIYAAVMPRAEALVRAGLKRAGEAPRDIRVAAVIEPTSSFEAELARVVLDGLAFNGLKAADQPDNFLRREIARNASNAEQVVRELYTQLPPDIVLSFAGRAFTAENGLMNMLNQEGWSNERPVYILSPDNAEYAADVTAELTRLSGEVDTRNNAGRVLGIAPAGPPFGKTKALNDFQLALPQFLPGASMDFGNYYDAFYFLVDALYTAPRTAFREGRINAEDLRTGMYRLTNPGEAKFDIGLDGISAVFSALDDANSELELDGTMGEPDFDRRSGMRRQAGSVYCFGGSRMTIQRDTLYFDRDENKLVPSPAQTCLINF